MKIISIRKLFQACPQKNKTNFFLFFCMCCLHFVARITLVLLILNVVCNRLAPHEKGPFEKTQYQISIKLYLVMQRRLPCSVGKGAIGSFFWGVVVNNIIVSGPSC